MTKSNSEQAKAQEFVRSVLEDTFHQKANEKTVRMIANKVVRVTAPEAPVERKRA